MKKLKTVRQRFTKKLHTTHIWGKKKSMLEWLSSMCKIKLMRMKGQKTQGTHRISLNRYAKSRLCICNGKNNVFSLVPYVVFLPKKRFKAINKKIPKSNVGEIQKSYTRIGITGTRRLSGASLRNNKVIGKSYKFFNLYF